jgi:hypothetical protein
VFGAAVVALLVVAQVPAFVGMDEPTAVRACTSDSAGCDALCPLVTQLAVVGAIAAFSGVTPLEVALPVVLAPAGVTAAGCVAGEAGTARTAHSEAGFGSRHGSIVPSIGRCPKPSHAAGPITAQRPRSP